MAPHRKGITSLDSYTTECPSGGNQTFKVGETVLLRNEEEREKPYVATLEEIYQWKYGRNMVKVRWFYLPEEIQGGRRDFHGANEVFLSDSCGKVEAATIECSCKVHSISEYEMLKNRTATDYFCRFAYSPGPPPIFYPEETDIYCVCKRPYNPDKCMFQCGLCLNWFHPSCLNMTEEGARVLANVSHFYCKICLPKMPADL